MSEKKKKEYNLRVIICFFLIMSGFLSCIVRIAVIMGGNYSEVQSEQNSYRVEIGNIRGTIFDCNRIPITNSKSVTIAAVVPNDISKEMLLNAVYEENKDNLLSKLDSSAPFVIKVNKEINLDGIKTIKYYEHNMENMSGCHIIGYVGNDGHGVSGLEKAYDHLLYSDQKVSALFKTDGKGEVLKGEDITVENDVGKVADGIVSTIDINFQTAIERAMSGIEKGAAIVIEIKSGKIRAMASKPFYDVTNVSKYLNDENSPLLNRCLSAYNVGSVFKPCVAAAAIEANTGNYSINCVGFEVIADRKFSCHKKSGHSFVDIGDALSESCNVFFYNLALKIGGDSVYNMASNLGFGNKIKLCEGIYTNAGNLTDRELLSNDAELANLSIGQGRLLLSPVSVLTLYCAIAGDGSYILPSIVEGKVEKGIFKKTDTISPTRVMSSDTAATIRVHLKKVVTDGTGKAAKPKTLTAAGKTATAQTGKYKDGIEITHSWFCGFFPADNPLYAVCVMEEDGNGAAEVFAKIADNIAEESPDF